MLALLLALLNAAAFDVASVKRSQTLLGPDANNRIVFAPAGVTAGNATLRRLVAEAYHLQLRQVLGPNWLDRNEYDVEAKTAGPVPEKDLAVMLQSLLAERFNLKQHRETRQLRVYELVVDKGGRKVQSGNEPGMRFHGNMRQLADIIAVQLSIPVSDDPTQPARASGTPPPVLDKTGLSGTYDFSLNIRPEPGSDMMTIWQRVLRDDLGLRLESRRADVEVVVIDSADQIPTAN
jgi:uncharacterized protein (TIGR03435 family)